MMSIRIDMRPEHEQTIADISRAVAALPIADAGRVGDDLGIDTETPYDDGTDLDREDIAAMVEGRLIDVLVNCGLATATHEPAESDAATNPGTHGVTARTPEQIADAVLADIGTLPEYDSLRAGLIRAAREAHAAAHADSIAGAALSRRQEAHP